MTAVAVGASTTSAAAISGERRHGLPSRTYAHITAPDELRPAAQNPIPDRNTSDDLDFHGPRVRRRGDDVARAERTRCRKEGRAVPPAIRQMAPL